MLREGAPVRLGEEDAGYLQKWMERGVGVSGLLSLGEPCEQKQVSGTPLLFGCQDMSDIFFLSAFTVAFLFNWIGFFLSFCLTTSAAGRYGAISGFGLSLIKWILIVRVSCTPSRQTL